jgi:hypothetical protein
MEETLTNIASPNSVLSALPSLPSLPSLGGSLSKYLAGFGIVIAIVIVVIGLIGYLYFQQFVYYWRRISGGHHGEDWMRHESHEEREEHESHRNHKEHSKPATWCFVGEDLLGRYCVKVPGPHACTPDRSYTSDSDCRLIPAQHLPAGTVMNNATRMLPLSSQRIE